MSSLTNPTVSVLGNFMQTYFKQGAAMRVVGGVPEIHGFELGELVLVQQVRPEPELSHVALCSSMSRDHQAILMIEETEDL